MVYWRQIRAAGPKGKGKNTMNVQDLFLKYVKIHSVSAMGAEENPSYPLEWDIA